MSISKKKSKGLNFFTQTTNKENLDIGQIALLINKKNVQNHTHKNTSSQVEKSKSSSDLKKELDELRKNYLEIKQQKISLELDLNDISQERNTLLEKIKENEAKINELTTIIDQQKTTLDEYNNLKTDYTLINEKHESLLEEQRKLYQSYNELINSNIKLESRSKELEIEISTLHSEIAKLKLNYQMKEKESCDEISKLKKEIEELNHSKSSEIHTLNERLNKEIEKVKQIASQNGALEKELDNKTRKLERFEEFLNISKTMVDDLKKEKDMLAIRLKDEEERVKKLHSLVESSNNESKVESENLKLKQQLFYQYALSLKLDRFQQSHRVNTVQISDLWEQVQNLPSSEWHRYVSEAIRN